jgi:hypothetical protein
LTNRVRVFVSSLGTDQDCVRLALPGGLEHIASKFDQQNFMAIGLKI